MRFVLLAAVLMACGASAPSAEHDRSFQASAACETNLDAGTPCDPCPGNTGSRQQDYYLLPDGGWSPVYSLTQRECDCPGGGHVTMFWVSCPLFPESWQADMARNGSGRFPQTCAEVASAWIISCR